ncbi:MAG: ACT domain-containing protein [Anaerolineae bacterium]|jgi:hypothetical protein|nr:ACT domain-containing protein [Anaerolineae bacterium]
MPKLTLELFPETYLVCRMDASTQAANIWLPMEGFWSLTRTADEVSLVMAEGNLVPTGAEVEADWRLMRVAGTLAFSLVGILAELTQVLADAEISIFALSTYDTDYLLLKSQDLPAALEALNDANCPVREYVSTGTMLVH